MECKRFSVLKYLDTLLFAQSAFLSSLRVCIGISLRLVKMATCAFGSGYRTKQLTGTPYPHWAMMLAYQCSLYCMCMWQSQVENEHYSTVSRLIRLVISLECFIEITPDFLCPFMNA